ncbi:MAG: phosphoribosylglycinamide formyltransferase [Ardenticatenaceae bacterium]|nr:phosphoribosylglycinamide formyltransferase [Ardenticatenaceae bacterium]
MNELSGNNPRLAIFVSGSGTNLQALIDAVHGRDLLAQIAVVVANRRQAYGLVRAQKAGIPTLYFPLKPYTDAGQSRVAYDVDLAEKVAAFAPDLIVLAGWMHVLSPAFLDHFPYRVINLHPALPGQFAGTQAIERAFAAFQAGEIDHSGCMVHTVIPAVDAGPVIDTAVVPFHPGDTLDDFAARMHAAEHRLIVAATRQALAQL